MRLTVIGKALSFRHDGRGAFGLEQRIDNGVSVNWNAVEVTDGFEPLNEMRRQFGA